MLNGDAPPHKPDGAPVLCAWPSSGARQILAESVESLAENLASHGESASLLVAIDREKQDMDARALGRLEGLSVRVADLEDRRRFLDLLPAHVDRDVASFALIPDEGRRGPGYNRNFLFLAAAGGNLVMTDDDILCEAVTSFDATTTVRMPAFTADPFPVPVTFFPDRAAALGSVVPADVNVVGRHRTLLGASVAGYDGTVALTCAGTWGDSGLGRARTILSLAGKDRERSFAFGYERVRYSRELVRVPGVDLVGPSMFFMAGQSGFDARDVLPPYFPFVGNEDGLFAMIVRACRKGSLTAYPAFALRHEPPTARALDPDGLTDAAPTVTDLMMSSLLICLEGARTGDARGRMAAIGSGYVALASLGTSPFVESVHDAWSRGAMAYEKSLESLLARHGREPGAWAADVESTLAHARELLREPTLLFGPTGCGLGPDALRDLMAAYGLVLEQWPAIFDFARDNRDFFGR